MRKGSDLPKEKQGSPSIRQIYSHSTLTQRSSALYVTVVELSRYYSQLSISLCYLLGTLGYHMSHQTSCVVVLRQLCQARKLIAKVIAFILRLVYSGVTERTIGKRVFIPLSLSLHFLVNQQISLCLRVSRCILCYAMVIQFQSLVSLRLGF